MSSVYFTIINRV